MEVVLIIAAAGGLLGCFGSVARLNLKGGRSEIRRPIGRCEVRPIA